MDESVGPSDFWPYLNPEGRDASSNLGMKLQAIQSTIQFGWHPLHYSVKTMEIYVWGFSDLKKKHFRAYPHHHTDAFATLARTRGKSILQEFSRDIPVPSSLRITFSELRWSFSFFKKSFAVAHTATPTQLQVNPALFSLVEIRLKSLLITHSDLPKIFILKICHSLQRKFELPPP